MIEFIIIIAIAVFILYSKFRPKVPDLQPQKTPVIEDSSILKQQLAETQKKFTDAIHELGKLNQNYYLEQNKNAALANEFIQLQDKFNKLQHQKKSSEVKTGTFVEILSPIAEEFPVDPKTMRFLGSPIDYISFCYEKNMITLVEVKSGDSQLNENQRRVKKMVENGRIEFKIVRLNEKGIKVK